MGSSESNTVLLVEDNPTDVFVIKEVLDGCGLDLRLQIARNGDEALRYFQAIDRDKDLACPALVLLDLNLPKVTGIELLREIRSRPRCRRTPVIVVTSSAAGADRAAADKLGAEGYFQKPSDLKTYMELGPLMVRVLEAARKRKDL